MRKLIFIICLLFLFIGNINAKENEVLKVFSLTNECNIVEDNIVVIPVNVIALNNGSLTTLINEYSLGYIDNDKDNVIIRITNINGVRDIIVDSNRNSESRSRINYFLDEDINANKLENIFSFNIQIEFINEIPDTYYVLGKEVLLSSDKKICDDINGYEITEVEKIKYVDLSKVDHTEMINDLITKVIIWILIVIIIVLCVMLWRRKK
jgi:hypothetical protein